MTGFSPRFLHAVVAEIESVERRIDRLDRRIERAKRQETKDRLRAERESLDRYARWLRTRFLR
jgi:septal ring factor EnvC (AmiA/AmiB activator)